MGATQLASPRYVRYAVHLFFGLCLGTALLPKIGAAAETREPQKSRGPVAQVEAQELPNLSTLLTTNDTAEATQFLKSLITYSGSCGITFDLRYKLTDDEYLIIFKRFLPLIRRAGVNRDSKSECLGALFCVSLRRTLRDVHLNAEVAEWLKDEEALVRVVAMRILVSLDARECDVSIAEMLESPDEMLRKASIESLVALGSRCVEPALIRQLEEGDPLRKYYAIQDILKIGAKRAIPALVRHLGDPDKNTRSHAMSALFELDARDQASAVRQAILEKHPEDEGFVSHGLVILAKWGDEWPIPKIMELMKHGPSDYVFGYLEKYEVEQVVDPCIACLREPELIGGKKWTNSEPRRRMMELITKLGKERAIPVLREVVRGADSLLASYAMGELAKLRAKEAVPEIARWIDDRTCGLSAFRALARIASPEAVPIVVSYVKRRQNLHLTESLTDLAAAADEQRIETLHITPIECRGSSLEQVATDITRLTGISVNLTSEAQANANGKRSGVSAGTTRRAIDIICGALDHNGKRFSIYISNGTIYIGTQDEVLAFWDEWMLKNGLTP